MVERARILVVDDDARIAASVRRALIYEGYEVEVAADGREALTVARDRPPALIVLDLMMPEVDGLEVCRRLRAADDDVAVLMLTAKSDVPDRVAGLDAGADDYLVKPFAHDELLARVRSLLRRRPAGSGQEREILTIDDVEMDVDGMEVTRAGNPIELTALEFRLLEYLIRNARVVLSRGQILTEVWGLDTDTTSNVVDVYVRYLRQKLAEPQIIQTVRGVGYVLRPVTR